MVVLNTLIKNNIRSRNNEQLYQLLTEFGVNNLIDDRDGETPLTYAISEGNLEAVEIILGLGPDVNKASVHGTPLMCAVGNLNLDLHSQLEIVDVLMHMGADINAIVGDLTALLVVIKKIMHDLTNHREKVEETTLMMVLLLKKYKADPNVTPENVFPPLFEVVSMGDVDLFNLFMTSISSRHPINLDVRDSSGSTCLGAAINLDNNQIAQALIINGASVIDPIDTARTHTPLTLACTKNNILIVSTILGTIRDIQNSMIQTDIRSNTPLMLACRRKALNMVILFLEVITDDASINHANLRGDTALILACRIPLINRSTPEQSAKIFKNTYSIVKLLLSRGADPEMTNIDGVSALDEARDAGNSDVVQLLADY